MGLPYYTVKSTTSFCCGKHYEQSEQHNTAGTLQGPCRSSVQDSTATQLSTTAEQSSDWISAALASLSQQK